jgi:hypothetical protein
VTVCAEPPRRETTRPVPRHGGQGRGSSSVGVSSSAIGGVRLVGPPQTFHPKPRAPITARPRPRPSKCPGILLFQLSVGHLPGLDVRVLVTLWHLAARFAKVTPGGVLLPLPLTHRAIAAIVGTRRPAATAAIGRLRERGAVERAPAGAWLLHGEPPAELARAREAAHRSVRHDG